MKEKEWGKRLEQLREQHGWTKKEVSYKLGFTENTYGNYERQQSSPSLYTLMKIADLYGVTLDYIVFGVYQHGRIPGGKSKKSTEPQKGRN
ncbi:helix-turn-helix domain-containing protein [Virgibacillus sediminis]|uniref:Helix-turn-helix domain-containing protein n=1 Tax=Virgibacillus sediminis TaxID=202260 RepID=A0ABV7A5A4_9BACI